MTFPLGPLDDVAFVTFGAATTWGELAAFVTGAACVWLVAREHVANWPIGIANAAFFGLLFANFGLYADAGLQVVYIVLGVYGWWAWRHGTPGRDPLTVSRTAAAQWAALGAATAAATALGWVALAHLSDSTVPGWDALTTAVSLAATWGQCRKKLESWWLWMAADVVYVPLYAYKDLWLTAALYVVFFALCVGGLRDWRRSLAGLDADGGAGGDADGGLAVIGAA